jgi:hypothetical protein
MRSESPSPKSSWRSPQHTSKCIKDLLVQRLDAAFVRTPALAGDELVEGLSRDEMHLARSGIRETSIDTRCQ